MKLSQIWDLRDHKTLSLRTILLLKDSILGKEDELYQLVLK